MDLFALPDAVLVGLSVLLVAVCLGIVGHRHRRRQPPGPLGPAREPASSVRLLESDDELQVAIQRAARFERRLGDAVKKRSDRYDWLMSASLASRSTEERSRPAGSNLTYLPMSGDRVVNR